MKQKWFYAVRGRGDGPVDFARLVELASSGAIGGGDLVWRKGLAAWTRADAVEELRACFRPVVSVPAPRASSLAPPVRLAKGLYVAGWIAACLAWTPLAFERVRELPFVAPAIALAWLAAFGMCLAFVHRSWSAIDDGATRLQPAHAIAGLFVPLFNLYWLFRVYPGFAAAYDEYVARHVLSSASLSRVPHVLFASLTLATLAASSVCTFFARDALAYVAPPLALAHASSAAWMAASTCDAVNVLWIAALGARAQHAGSQRRPT